MFFKAILPLLGIISLFQMKTAFAEDISFLSASPEVLKSVIQGMADSSSILPAIDHCKHLSGDNHRACMELYSTENEPISISNLPPVEDCKVFTGEQFRTCIEIYMLEKARLINNPSNPICKSFDGKNYRLCSEMPTPFIHPNCKDCASEKLRLCILIYLPDATNNTVYHVGNDSVTSITTPTTHAPSETSGLTATPISSHPTVKIYRGRRRSTLTSNTRHDRSTTPSFTKHTVKINRGGRRSTTSFKTTPDPNVIPVSIVDKVQVQRRRRHSTSAPAEFQPNCEHHHHHY